MEARALLRRTGLQPTHGRVGIALLIAGEGLLLARVRPVSDYYFPFVWYGLILFLDAAVYQYTGSSLWMSRRRLFFAMLPVSALFWWVFEAFNLAVHNWVYVGAGSYSGWAYVVFATVDFSTVLPAVWTVALLVNSLLPRGWPGGDAPARNVPSKVLLMLFLAGVLAVALPIRWPDAAFPLVWISLLLLLDPINCWLGRPSMIRYLRNRIWRPPVAFALAGLMCGFFWESWNEWAMPKWIYVIPHVGFWRIFQMPFLGWGGYLPFGLELFAMANLILPFFGFKRLTLERPPESSRERAELAS